MRADHVIWVTGDLEGATAALAERTGVAPVAGGRHVGMGTHNAILPLNPGYVEVLAVADRAEAEASPFGQGILRRLAERGDGLWAWAVAVPDVRPVAERLGLEVSTIARGGLSASLAGLAVAMADPVRPFFIARDPGIADPAARGDAGGITSLELSGDPGRLAGWIDDLGIPVRFGPGPPGVVAVGIGGRELR